MSRTLVTGATGFLGRHLIAQLCEGGAHVIALCRGSAPELTALGVEVRRGDVLDAASVRAAAAGCETLYHCAGLVSRQCELDLNRDEAVLGAVVEIAVQSQPFTCARLDDARA